MNKSKKINIKDKDLLEERIKKEFNKFDDYVLNKNITHFDIEVFFSYEEENCLNFSAVMFSMNDKTEVYSSDNSFAGTVHLFDNFVANFTEAPKDIDEEFEWYYSIVDELIDIIAKYTNKIKIPIYIMVHDTIEKINIKTKEVEKI